MLCNVCLVQTATLIVTCEKQVWRDSWTHSDGLCLSFCLHDQLKPVRWEEMKRFFEIMIPSYQFYSLDLLPAKHKCVTLHQFLTVLPQQSSQYGISQRQLVSGPWPPVPSPVKCNQIKTRGEQLRWCAGGLTMCIYWGNIKPLSLNSSSNVLPKRTRSRRPTSPQWPQK